MLGITVVTWFAVFSLQAAFLFGLRCVSTFASNLGASRLEKPNLPLPATENLLARVQAVVVFTSFVWCLTIVPISFPAPERRVRRRR
ncbi:MAG: hypothetical protein MUF71_22035 [Candidatus Kapabacteria bacterium]|nr:hypothetical protein [Candidatus Kapabacteria bacterium]